MVGIHIFPDGRVTRADAAYFIGIKPSTLRTWNCKGVHDDYFKKIVIANKVYYDFERVQACCEWR